MKTFNLQVHPQIHGMTLKYSDEDEVTDEEMRELNLQAATHQYNDAAGCTESLLLQFHFRTTQAPSQPTEEEDKYIPDGQNTRLSQVAQKQLVYLPDGKPWLQDADPVFASFLWYLTGF